MKKVPVPIEIHSSGLLVPIGWRRGDTKEIKSMHIIAGHTKLREVREFFSYCNYMRFLRTSLSRNVDWRQRLVTQYLAARRQLGSHDMSTKKKMKTFIVKKTMPTYVTVSFEIEAGKVKRASSLITAFLS
jgi:hypothetical protein